MLRRRRGRSDLAVLDAGRWDVWCARAAGPRWREEVPALLTTLREVLDTGPPHDRAAALDALGRAPAQLLVLLDRQARRSPQPRRITVRQVPRTPPIPARPDPGLLLASFDADGRIREAAVAGLAGCGGPLAAAALALRTVDWVPEVRNRAAAALLLRSAPDEVAAAVRILLRLHGRSRAGGLLTAYRAALADPPHRRAVRALAVDADPAARRFGVELALDLGEYVKGDLLRAALYDHDQVCRKLCAQRLLEIDPEQAGRLLRARGAGVRELAVAALPADVPATRLVVLLADRARMVRAQARWQLYQRGEPPAEVYRKQLRRAGRPPAPARLLAGLAAGLGECGDAADAPQLARLLGDPHAIVRRAAARALGRLAKPDELVRLLGGLATDPDSGVAREVFEALTRVPDDVPAETLWIGRTRTEPAVRALAERISRQARATTTAAAPAPAAKHPALKQQAVKQQPAAQQAAGYEQSGHRPR
ncbi:HEAT repeat domain-containing protein [Streptomyces sp. NBC_01190]|uniref:HEAT repeat domain-containing protein n=1 Tax=Streptomyces sp. NBC_01190 TaxID=2903767 RepID=UPI00386FA0E2|nr:HEAT repeat domain-containing protein [Streptomyces sp. NBC_01190]